jgi:hypothetical protein
MQFEIARPGKSARRFSLAPLNAGVIYSQFRDLFDDDSIEKGLTLPANDRDGMAGSSHQGGLLPDNRFDSSDQRPCSVMQDSYAHRRKWSVDRVSFMDRLDEPSGSILSTNSIVSTPITCESSLATRGRRFTFLVHCQGSSVVEQGTHKPLVGSSTLPPGILPL